MKREFVILALAVAILSLILAGLRLSGISFPYDIPFGERADETPLPAPAEGMTKIDQPITVENVTLTPLEVMEDSRCPSDVVCIQAGTVRLRTRILSGLGESAMILEMGKPVTTEAEEITLVNVLPEARSEIAIRENEYRFMFRVSDKVMITIDAPRQNALVRSPLTVTGEARGNWYFEASFPVRLFDGNGKEIAVVPAQAKGEWMTTNFVPFEGTLEFTTPATATGLLVFQKDNPSGLPEHDASVSIPVRFR